MYSYLRSIGNFSYPWHVSRYNPAILPLNL
jgi:hypothetical protein